jgi:hypothetical protein
VINIPQPQYFQQLNILLVGTVADINQHHNTAKLSALFKVLADHLAPFFLLVLAYFRKAVAW